MVPAPPVNEADLHAFVDGELAIERRAEVARFLAGEPAENARVENWQRQNRLVRAAFAAVEREPVPVSLSLAGLPVGRPPSPIKLAAVQSNAAALTQPPRQARLFILTFLCGIAATIAAAFVLQGPDLGKLGEFVVSGHATTLATRALAAVPRRGEAGATTIVREGALPLPNLAAHGYMLVGGDLKEAEAGASACLFYAKSSAGPLALCIERAAVGDDPSFRSLGDDARRAVYWREKAAVFALAGPLSEGELQKLARHVHGQVAGR